MADNKKSATTCFSLVRTIVLKTGDCQRKWASVLALLAPITLLVITLSVPEYWRFCWEISGFQMNHSPYSQFACRMAAPQAVGVCAFAVWEGDGNSQHVCALHSTVCDVRCKCRIKSPLLFLVPSSCCLYQWFKSCTYGLVFNWFLLLSIKCYEGNTMPNQKLKGKQVNNRGFFLILVNYLD